jgi:hypothetical protein
VESGSCCLMRPIAAPLRIESGAATPPKPSPALTERLAPSSSQPGGRLDSWKEIARYLSRDESTVQRWEKRESMPVHRHVHDKRGSAYAYPAELDAWWQAGGSSSRLLTSRPSQPIGGGDGGSELRRASWRFRRRSSH